VNREAVGDVAARAVDEQGDGPVAFVGELPEALDAGAGGVLLDGALPINNTEALALFLSQPSAHRIDELGDQGIAQLSHRSIIASMTLAAETAESAEDDFLCGLSVLRG